jgi:hypothetical protein
MNDREPHEKNTSDAPLSNALRGSPAACPDLRERVQGRVRQARALRRAGISTAVLLFAAGVAWQVVPRPEGGLPGPVVNLGPVEPKTPQRIEPRAAAEAIPTLPPVAQLEILSNQQSAVWASLEQLTQDL